MSPMEQTVENVQDLLSKESLALIEAQQATKLAQSSKTQREVFERWIATETEELSGSRGNVGPRALPLGLILACAARPNEAIEWLLKASTGIEKSLALGICYLQTGQFEKALEELDSAQKSGADEFTVAISKVEALWRVGRLEEAQNLLKQYEGREPGQQHGEICAPIGKTQADYWYQLGRICELQDQRDQALEHYEKALGLQEDHQGAHFRLGYYCDLAGDDESALEHYRRCTSAWPVHVNALLNLAVLYEDAENYNRAEACLRKILSANPNHARAKLYLKDVLGTRSMYYDEDQQRQIDRHSQVLEIPVTDFELSVRSRNCLKSMGLNNIGDLLRVTEHDLLGYKNFGETSLREIKAILTQKGLTLGELIEGNSPRHKTLEQDSGEQAEVSLDGARNLPLSEANFSVRVQSGLENLGAVTLGDVAGYSEPQLLSCKNFGKTSLDEVKLRLAEWGLSLAEDSDSEDFAGQDSPLEQ